jgi:hypothetical protein
VYSAYSDEVDWVPFIMRKVVLPFLCGPPSLRIWGEQVVALFSLCVLFARAFRGRLIGFLLMWLVGCVGAVVSGRIFPAPFLGERTLWFFCCLAVKVFAATELHINNHEITIRPLWLLVLLALSVHYGGGALRPLAFMWFCAHLFYFVYFIVPRVVNAAALVHRDAAKQTAGGAPDKFE